MLCDEVFGWYFCDVNFVGEKIIGENMGRFCF